MEVVVTLHGILQIYNYHNIIFLVGWLAGTFLYQESDDRGILPCFEAINSSMLLLSKCVLVSSRPPFLNVSAK